MGCGFQISGFEISEVGGGQPGHPATPAVGIIAVFPQIRIGQHLTYALCDYVFHEETRYPGND